MIHKFTTRIEDKRSNNNNDNKNNISTTTNNNINNNNDNKTKTKIKKHLIRPIERGETKKYPIVLEIKQAKVLKQIIMTPYHYLPTFLTRYPALSTPEKQLYK